MEPSKSDISRFFCPSRVSVCSSAHSPASSSVASTSKAADEVKSGPGHGGGSAASSSSEAADAHYLSANCVVFTYYTGDISSVVDEHFARALSQASSYSADAAKVSLKDTPPMTQRNFPPSFWNCNHQAASASSVGSLCAMTTANHHELSYATDPYHTGALHASIHQNDPWHYTLSTHAQAANPYTHRPSMHELSYSTVSGVAPGNRFNPQYGSLLLQPSMRSTRLTPVSAACTSFDKSAADTWGTARYHDPLPHNLSHMDANYSATYGTMSAMTGLEGQVQDASKDLYWF